MKLELIVLSILAGLGGAIVGAMCLGLPAWQGVVIVLTALCFETLAIAGYMIAKDHG